MDPPASPEPIDLPAVAAAADRALDKVANLVRGIPELSAKALPNWSIEQTAAHLMGVVGAYIDIARGAGSPYTDLSKVAHTNDELLARITERTPFQLSEQIQALRPALAAAVEQGPDSLQPGHLGAPTLRSIAVSRILGEAVVHGWDIATAAERLWIIEPSDAALIFRGFLPFLPVFVHPENAKGLTARFDVRVRKFPEGRAVFAFRDGVLTVEGEPAGRVDCVMSGAGPSLILIMHRRIGLAGPILRGQAAAWGPKPWLGFKLVSFFDAP
ncbi:maleylpyruvate isomerase N-terminal domain-containing protein [Sporichthya sp.]|uniref:maleylpyruvate isomerase N-terminal domain-containing protein n=1 Tax=Sporichthya sp. TaxID=65475 RepID=UPI001798109C|nr:maleylpyruvate isomerase N-terminal domain-containing protein [Sporichthya sp.]MBA3745563.1 maleylpyruvate isomerase N-terminal domain-containing protein [Sporichthya sp.]